MWCNRNKIIAYILVSRDYFLNVEKTKLTYHEALEKSDEINIHIDKRVEKLYRV